MRAIGRSAVTFDEHLHLLAGYHYLVTGSPRGYFGHPPAARAWAALPMLILRPELRFEHADQYHRAEFFLHKNRFPPETMINASRRFNLLTVGIAFILIGAAWAARWDGARAGAATAFFLAFCPSLAAHGSLITLDAAAALLYFAAAAALSQSVGTGRSAWAVSAGLLAGLASGTKFNFIFLPGVLIAALAAEVLFRRLAWRRAALLAGLMLCCGALALGAVYRWDWPAYFAGMRFMASMFGEGRASYLLGEHSASSFALYFPVAFLAKTPVPTILLAWLGLTLRVKNWREPRTLWTVFPMLAYFAAALTSSFQIGHRHILPVYPFLALLAAEGALWLWDQGGRARLACAGLALALAASVLRQSDFPLSYFNELAGGPDNGHRILVDSNLDWGQGLKPLVEELTARGNPAIYLSYFGCADPSAYGVRHVPVAPGALVERRPPHVRPFESGKILLAVSATNLHGVYYADKTLFSWLENRRPEKIIAHSIFLYDLTDDRDALHRLADLLQRDNRPLPASELRAFGKNGDTHHFYRKR